MRKESGMVQAVSQGLIEVLKGIGEPFHEHPGWALCRDLDYLKDYPPHNRGGMLRFARVELWQEDLETRLSEIQEAANENDFSAVEMLHQSFLKHLGHNDARLKKLKISASKWKKKADAISRSAIDPNVLDCVYFLTSDNLSVKIGFTNNLQSRLRSFNTATPNQITILLTIPGGQELEALLHKKFSSFRLKGEWFTLAPEIKDYIKQLNSQPHPIPIVLHGRA